MEVKLYSFINLGARCGWVVSITPCPLYPRECPINSRTYAAKMLMKQLKLVYKR